jgi:hypothetical protein
MPNWRFWERDKDDSAAPPEPPSAPPGGGRRLPPPRDASPRTADPETAAKLAALRKRREMLGFDLERAEAAHHPENPWAERIALLEESLDTIEADLTALEAIPPEPGFPLPPVPVQAIEVKPAEPASVSFAIGPERFLFEEETDWDQRGGPVVRGDLRQRTGDATTLVPPETPPDRREALAQHLVESVIVFATNLRDRALAGDSLPQEATLADLAAPCPECGGWREWGGVCEACASRAYRKQLLNAEALRLQAERDREAEDRHKWAERLPVARRRLRDLEADIAKLGG